MSETKFLSIIFTDGLLYSLIGLSLLILPKISSLSFGFMICLSFIFLGGYKIVTAFLNRNFAKHFLLDILIGLILFITGLILFFIPVFDVMIVISLIGTYFVLKSISSVSFGIQTRKILSFWWLSPLNGIIELLFGIITIIAISTGALWFTGILAGINFILEGFVYSNMYISTKYREYSVQD